MRSLQATMVAISAILSLLVCGGCQALLNQQPTIRVGRSIRPDISRSHSFHWQSAGLLAAATANDTPDTSVLEGCKLSYFGIPGRGEAIRLALAIGGIEFEDNRIPFPAWGKVKPTTPWGTLPVLELADGTQLAQARSLLRFVGKYTDPVLYPDDPLLAQKVDELMDVLEDLGTAIAGVGQGLSKEEMEAERLVAVSEGGTLYKTLSKIDAFIEKNGSNGHAVGEEMNIASILTFTSMGRMVGGVYFGIPPTACDAFPNIQLVRKMVGNHPAVVAWYDARIQRQKTIEKLSPAEQVLVNCRNL